jgi:hypothetical protein
VSKEAHSSLPARCVTCIATHCDMAKTPPLLASPSLAEEAAKREAEAAKKAREAAKQQLKQLRKRLRIVAEGPAGEGCIRCLLH